MIKGVDKQDLREEGRTSINTMWIRSFGDYPVLDLWRKRVYRLLRQGGATLLLGFAIVSGGGVRSPSVAYAYVLPSPTACDFTSFAYEILVDEAAVKPNPNFSAFDFICDASRHNNRTITEPPAGSNVRFWFEWGRFKRGVGREVLTDRIGWFFWQSITTCHSILNLDWDCSCAPEICKHDVIYSVRDDHVVSDPFVARRNVVWRDADYRQFESDHCAGAKVCGVGSFLGLNPHFLSRLAQSPSEPSDETSENRRNQDAVTIKLEKYPTDNTDGYIMGFTFLCAVGYFAYRYFCGVSK